MNRDKKRGLVNCREILKGFILCSVVFTILMEVLPMAYGAGAAAAKKADRCHGRFINVITDICWTCIFPITIGSTEVASFGMRENSADNPSSPICSCSAPPPIFREYGIAVGFWEASKLADVTKKPLCFTSLDLDLSGSDDWKIPEGMNDSEGDTQETSSFYHVHWFEFPLLSMLNIMGDEACRDGGDVDSVYITEYDTLWDSDELSFLINPEAALFANVLAQVACAADCVAASFGYSLDVLFWCAGCQGSLYPFNGHVDAHTGGVQGATLLVERMTAKLHRLGMAALTSTEAALCGKMPSPLIKKSQYRYQLTYPLARTQAPLCCGAFGSSEMLVDVGQEIPVIGEDYGFVIWRKRNCCVR